MVNLRQMLENSLVVGTGKVLAKPIYMNLILVYSHALVKIPAAPIILPSSAIFQLL
jgi:hypothetical protein